MLACIEHKGKHFRVDLNKPIDLSIPLKKGENNPTAWVCTSRKDGACCNGQLGRRGKARWIRQFF